MFLVHTLDFFLTLYYHRVPSFITRMRGFCIFAKGMFFSCVVCVIILILARHERLAFVPTTHTSILVVVADHILVAFENIQCPPSERAISVRNPARRREQT